MYIYTTIYTYLDAVKSNAKFNRTWLTGTYCTLYHLKSLTQLESCADLSSDNRINSEAVSQQLLKSKNKKKEIGKHVAKIM